MLLMVAAVALAACEDPYKYGPEPGDQGAKRDSVCTRCDLGLVTGPDSEPVKNDLGKVILPDLTGVDGRAGSAARLPSTGSEEPGQHEDAPRRPPAP